MSWIQSAKVGDKVVCIKDAVRKIGADHGFPLFKKGEVYTISEIKLLDCGWDMPQPFLSFVGLDPRHTGHYEGFRPVQPRATDISIFQAMLKPATAPVREEVE